MFRGSVIVFFVGLFPGAGPTVSSFLAYGVEQRIKTLIATKASGEKAPGYLVERVRLQISRTTIIRYD